MKIKSIDLAWISVSDFAKSKQFFVDTLGLKVTGGAQEYSWLELSGQDGGCGFGLGGECSESEVKPGQNAVLTFTVDDIESAKAELDAKGVKTQGIKEVPGHVKLCTFTDPDGSIFQLVQCLDECK